MFERTWPSAANLCLGLWLIVSPFVFGTSHTPQAHDIIVGGIVVALSGLSLFVESMFTVAAWVNLFLGIWVVFAPATFQYGALRFAASSDVAVGIALASFAAIRIGLARPSALA